MAITLSILVARPDEPFGATVLMTLVVGIAVTAVILWNRRYRRIWQQYGGSNWPKVAGSLFVWGGHNDADCADTAARKFRGLDGLRV